MQLSIMFFLILAELAVGGFLVVLLVDYGGIATRGFLGLGAVTYLATGLAAWWARGQITAPAEGARAGFDPAWRALEGGAFGLFLAALGLYTLAMFGSGAGPRRAAGTLAALGGGLALIASGLAYRMPHADGISTLVGILTGSLVIGSATSGMILGHWYLVTPDLSARPLVEMTGVLLAALLIQAALVPVWLALAAGAADAGALLAGIYAVPFWLRVLVGIALPLTIAAMTLHCCRIRALQSATGLLYVAVALVLAGEIAAKLLLVLSGVPV